MDVNGDGKVDILSGSYSRQDKDMAGLFQVMWGGGGKQRAKRGKRARRSTRRRRRGAKRAMQFAKPEVLKGEDGEPLIIPADKQHVTDKICTRPTAVDLDGDGKLDIVSGNFAGTFALFRGLGKGEFASQPEWLTSGGERLTVGAHGDPCFADWDGDGDLDLLSGSSHGGVYLFENQGSAKQPKFGPRQELVKAVTYSGKTTFGEGHLTGPQSATRICVADVNGDQRLDLLIGDNAVINSPARGLDEKTALKKLEVWNAKTKELSEATRQNGSAKEQEEAHRKFSEHWKTRDRIVHSDRTGFVWVMLRRKSAVGGGR